MSNVFTRVFLFRFQKIESMFIYKKNKRLEEYQLRHILEPDVLQLNEDQFNVHEIMNKKNRYEI